MALRHYLPRRPAWLAVTSLLALAALAAFAGVRWRGEWAPGRPAGLVAGTGAALLVALDALYPLRRRLRIPVRASAQWLQIHVYGGGLALVLAALHTGLRLPAGPLGWTMLATGTGSVATGVLGIVLQKHVPAVLTNELTVEMSYERIPQRAERLQQEADQLIDGSPDLVQRVYRRDIRPVLASLQPSYAYLLDVGSTAQRLAPLRGLQPFVPEAERARLEDLAAIVDEKHQLDVSYSLQRVLRQWVVLHVPIACAFLALLVLHVVLVLSF
jgi:hypothetical protein